MFKVPILNNNFIIAIGFPRPQIITINDNQVTKPN